MRKVMFALAIVAGAFMTAGPASAQCRYIMNDVGRFHGYLSGPCNGAAVGYAGAHTTSPALSCLDQVLRRRRPPAEKPTARQDQAGKASTSDSERSRTASRAPSSRRVSMRVF
jgi:hypothetical protein